MKLCPRVLVAVCVLAGVESFPLRRNLQSGNWGDSLPLGRNASVAAEVLSPISNSSTTITTMETKNRAASVSPTDITCTLGNEHVGDTSVEAFSVPFYYALGTNGTMDSYEIFQLQQRLFNAVEQSISWCYGLTVSAKKEGGIRRLSHTRGEIENQRARQLEIVTVAVGPTDATIGECPDTPEIQQLMTESGATACQINEGSLRVLAHNVDDLKYMSAVFLDSMEAAMNVEMVWDYWKLDLADLSFLSYVGDSMEEVYPPAGDADNSYMALILGLGIPAVLALLLFGFVRGRDNRDQMTSRAFHNMMYSEYVLVGTGDPPASFHEGLYHYMRNGTRYLSTNCEGCLETRRNMFFTDDNLGTIMEDTEFEENVLITACDRTLGKRAKTMNVHKCKSATCNKCIPTPFRGPKFIPSRGVTKQDDIVFSEGNVEV